ncbi:MAG: phosphoenolpyruvate synthase, partial [Propionibacteriaceae bacterium]|nr:phosphoenolpyruvate synthase [Propionibacteriaceae bacterium]
MKTVLSFDALDRDSLPAAGGKAANLGELTRAGFPVPRGFCVTTAAYAIVSGNAGLDATLDALDDAPANDTERLSSLASGMRETLRAAPVPEGVARSITEAYRELADGAPVPVAVRSSATAEDLPHASFAGQQDTYLNVVGEESLLDAVRRCWASLWTDRAVSYRARNGVSHRGVRLAVVVQQMVESEVSGILFTANPLTGKRHQAVLDASPGLGEAVVSGAVNPDHFVVDTATGGIVKRRPGDKRMAVRSTPGGGTHQVESEARDAEYCLTDEQVRSLSTLGARVEDYYGAPQDIEWAIDPDGKTWLVQARPITTLFPLPAGATDDEFRAYLSLSVVQGVYRPLTPMGVQVFRLISTSVSILAGHPPPDKYAGIAPLTEAAGRLFFDVTPALRSTFGRRLLSFVTSHMEARATPILQRLAGDSRFSTVPTPWVKILRSVLTVLVKGRTPLHVVRALASPEAARARVERVVEEIRATGNPPRDSAERLAEIERILLSGAPRILPGVPPTFIAGLGANALAGKLLGDLATEGERRTVMGALPHNPTTEMNLALWALAEEIREYPAAAQTVSETPPEQLSRDYQSGSLPAQLQAPLKDFLVKYGHRGVAEIDVGLPRWAEDPTQILGVLANYLRLEDPEAAPDAQFKQAERRAREMSDTLARRASR